MEWLMLLDHLNIATGSTTSSIMYLSSESMYLSADPWDIDEAESNVRRILGVILGIIIAIRVTKLYNDGQNGKAIAQGIIGGLLALFIFDADVFKSIMGFFKNMLGF